MEGESTSQMQGPGHSQLKRVSAQGLTRRFGRRYALYRVDLEIEVGRCCALMGHNGSGKTTLLNLLSGLMRPTEGSVKHTNDDNQPLSPADARRQLGFMSHKPMTYGELSGMENLELFGKLHGVRPLSEKARNVLVDVGLNPDDERPCNRYSHGMRRRLALARAILPEPRWLLLDEPGSGMDSRSKERLARTLEAIRSNTAIVLITHDPGFAAMLANQVTILNRGKKAAERSGDRFDAKELTELYETAMKDPGGGPLPRGTLRK